MNDIRNFPKVELHLHLDGSVMIETAKKLCNKNIDEIKSEMIANKECENLSDYLTKFSFPISIMQTKEELEEVATALGTSLLEDGVMYAEIRFAPINHISKGLSLEEVVDSVLNGLKKIPLKTNLILCMMRNSSFEENKLIVELASHYLNEGVVSLDLAGDEYNYKTKEFKNLFDYATKLGVPFTIHAGEADGIDSINAALSFGAKRLGHGIRCIENNNVLEYIKNNNILLEICPTSNIQTRVVDSLNKHPIKYLYENGIKVCINTDNRTVSNVTLTEEYKKLIDGFNFSYEDLKEMNLNAIRYSFLNDNEKEVLEKEYLCKYLDFINKKKN